jgi:hypothetical protein
LQLIESGSDSTAKQQFVQRFTRMVVIASCLFFSASGLLVVYALWFTFDNSNASVCETFFFLLHLLQMSDVFVLAHAFRKISNKTPAPKARIDIEIETVNSH